MARQQIRVTARVMGMAVHPYISGTPHRIGYFEKVLEHVSGKPGVLFCQGGEILDWYRAETRAR